MATSLFDDKRHQPNSDELRDVLGSSFSLWEQQLDYFYDTHDVIETDWKFYSKNSGWCLKVYNETGKNLAFLLPNKNYFIVTINMSTKIRDQMLHLDLSKHSIDLLNQAKVYSEGISVLFRVESSVELSEVLKILRYKG